MSEGYGLQTFNSDQEFLVNLPVEEYGNIHTPHFSRVDVGIAVRLSVKTRGSLRAVAGWFQCLRGCPLLKVPIQKYGVEQDDDRKNAVCGEGACEIQFNEHSRQPKPDH